MKSPKIASLLLASTIACTACGSGSGTTNDTTASQDTESTVQTEPDIREKLNLGTYNNAEINILFPSQHSYEFCEEADGDIVNDAVYARDSKIEETLKVKLNYITETGDWAGKDTFNGRIKNSVLAEDNEFDLVDGMIAVVLPLATEGVFIDIASIDKINFDDPWWATDFYDNMNIAGKLYGIAGSSLMSDYKSSYAMYANMKLIEDRKLADPISLVLDGKWTLDSMISIAKDQSADLDNNEIYDDNDFYGIVNWDVPLRALQTATEIALIGRDSENKLVFNGLTDRVADIVSKCGDFFSNLNNHAYTSGFTSEEAPQMFLNDLALLYTGTIGNLEKLRDMSSDFAILPLPKYDENQEEYYTQIATGSGMWFIPQTTENLEMIADFMNLHGSLSLTEVIPIFFEKALKTKYVRDERNTEIIDIIIKSLSSRIDFLYASTLGVGTNSLLFDMIVKGNEPASTLEGIKLQLEAAIDNLYETFEELN